MIDQRLFQILFIEVWVRIQIKEFKHIRITDTVGRHTEAYSEIIQNEVKKLVLYFRKENAKYNPFKQVR